MFTRLSGRARALLSSAVLGLAITAPAHALDPQSPPSGNFDLANWKLTLPNASEVMPWVLSNGWTQANVFYTESRSGGMVFRCPNIASTTQNSNYSRTELREMLDPTASAHDASNNWTTAKGGRMKARLRVDRVSTTGDSSKVGRVIIGQIHGSEHEPARLYFHKLPGEAKGRIYLASETTGGSTSWSTDIVSNKNGDGIALGELFTYVITLQDTRLQIDIIRNQGTLTNTYIKFIDPGYRSDWMYFKAGVYNQNNTGTSTDYVQATFHSLTHTH